MDLANLLQKWEKHVIVFGTEVYKEGGAEPALDGTPQSAFRLWTAST